MVAIRVYVEGGGDSGDLHSRCRHGFSELFKKVMPPKSMPKVIACGSRRNAFDMFCTALDLHPDMFCVLLVDSEAPVAIGTDPWDYLRTRDNWVRPSGADNDGVHLMVQVMESWFLADKDALERFYGQGFHHNALRGRENVEDIAKNDVLNALKEATRHTRTKGKYGKGKHSFEILALIDPTRLRNASPNHAARLFDTLLSKAREQQL